MLTEIETWEGETYRRGDNVTYRPHVGMKAYGRVVDLISANMVKVLWIAPEMKERSELTGHLLNLKDHAPDPATLDALPAPPGGWSPQKLNPVLAVVKSKKESGEGR